MRPTLVVMAKAPVLGGGKTRLAADVGRVEAWRINRRLQARTLRAIVDPRWDVVLCVAPRKALELRLPGVWPARLPRERQHGDDLGERLAHALRGRRRVAVIGTDAPQLRRAHIAAAFAALRRSPFALGPALDGGFWLLAARSGAAAAAAMAYVRWSTSSAAEDVIANLGKENVALLGLLRDVDVAADL